MTALALILIITLILSIPVWMMVWSHHIQNSCVVYCIKKGKHYSYRLADWIKLPFKLAIARGTRLSFRFMFSDACLYPMTSNDDYDINKLYGITFGFDEHYRSLRLGWRCIDGKIQIFTYWYSDGKRGYTYLWTVEANETYLARFNKISNAQYQILLTGSADNLLANAIVNVNSSSDIVKFKLWPYFGGNLKAPQDMKIYITEIK